MTDFDNMNTPDLSGNGANPQPEQPAQEANGQTYTNQPYGQPEQPYGAGYQQPYGQPNQQYGYNAQNQYQQPYGQPNQQYGYNAQNQYQQPYPQQQYGEKSKVAAGLLGIFLGSLGIHNFYLGFQGKALAQLLITLLTCGAGSIVTGIWGLIEGILILTGSIAVDANGVPLRD